MANFDFEAPSFSLGFDLDLHSEPKSTPRPDPITRPPKRPSTASNLRTIEEDDDDDFESPAVRVSDPPRAFKRLRRGPAARPTPEARKTELVDEQRFDVDEEIESFSSDEDCSRGILPGKSVCSSSKPSLHGQRILTTQSGSQWKSRMDKQLSSASTSVTVENKGSNCLFPKLTLSPLRRFQLIDSDSDDPSVIENPRKEVPCVILSQEDKQSNISKHAALGNLGTRRSSSDKEQNDDLWKDFCNKKNSNIPTPAFDEVLEEYFTNGKNKSKPEIGCNDTYNEMKCDDSSHPPAQGYFFHKDTRIQKLVRDRLPYFFPLGAGQNQEYQQQNVSVIDYMGQFGHEETRQTNRGKNIEKSSKKTKKVAKKSQVDNKSQDSEWVNPRSSAGRKKNAGSRRVQATSNSAGHWYMGSDGRRVYVSKNGQELTGQIAYMHYRKESGAGFKNSKKKKAAAKKKTAAKKKSVSKKK